LTYVSSICDKTNAAQKHSPMFIILKSSSFINLPTRQAAASASQIPVTLAQTRAPSLPSHLHL
jgi:hypothetical protein